MSWGAGTPCLPRAVPSSALLAPQPLFPAWGAPTTPHSRLLRRSWQLLLKVPGFLVGGFVSDPLHGQTLSLMGDVSDDIENDLEKHSLPVEASLSQWVEFIFQKLFWLGHTACGILVP